MKLTLAVLSVIGCSCVASAIQFEQNKVQKRSSGGDEWLSDYYRGSYGLSSASLAAPSFSTISVGAPSISSHTHTHSTAIIDRPYPVPSYTPSISSSSILPTTFSSYNYGLGSYPYNFGYPYGSYGSSLGYGGKSFTNFGKYYSRSYPTIYKKSFYPSPALKYKW